MDLQGSRQPSLLLVVACSYIFVLASAGVQHRNKRQACGSLKFQCKNGECIDSFQVCDGAVDCSDQSDENQVTCGSLNCPNYLFRCSYGACVGNDAKCNGQQDCADNSDELLPECPGVSITDSKACPALKFKCNSGECIDDFLRCDGSNDCSDGSDETLTQCSKLSCPDFLFRCAYGACIDKSGKCDGKVQCEGDSSDEDPALCGTSTVVTCTLPLKQEHGGYTVGGCTPPTCTLGPGAQVPFGTLVNFICDTGYKPTGIDFSICTQTGFSSPPPVCEKIQCPPIVDDSLEIRCLNSDGQDTPCDKPMSVGSKAILSCKDNFIKTSEFSYPPLTCTDKGTWDRQPYTCIPDCGKPVAKGQTFILNGTVAKAGEFPWHVGLYSEEDGDIEQICGGSIITRRLILTAAHCFVKSRDPAAYKVAVGKYQRSWKLFDPTEQRIDVESINIKPTYRGPQRKYGDDIALVVLKVEITISNFARPVCVDLESQYVNFQLSPGKFGTATGWGITENNKASEILLTTKLPFVGFTECYDNVPLSFRDYFTSDKFCAGYLKGSAVCKGDSGGGLAFEQEVTSKTKQWFVQGVVSLGVPSPDGKECSGQRALFTKVESHKEWIRGFYDKYS